MNKETILGFDITTYKTEELIKNIFNDYSRNEQLFIVNINPEIVVSNYKNEELKNIFNKQKYQIPDGSGIIWASKKNNGHITERITGIDLMEKICEKSQEYNSRICLYGGKKEIAEKARQELEIKYPEIEIIGTIDGYGDESKAIEEIKILKPDILFVGLGSPLQEDFIIKHEKELDGVKIMMPVGGSFDVISKTKKRAPDWMIKKNIEWLYRLYKEPTRIFRQMKLIKFMWLVVTNKEKKG